MPRKTRQSDLQETAPKPAARRTRTAGPVADGARGAAPHPAKATPARRRQTVGVKDTAQAAKPVRKPAARRAAPRRQTAGSEPLAVVADRGAVAEPTRETVAVPEPTHAEIAERAYHLSERRGGYPGDPAHDWAQAEYELRRERGLI